MGDDRLGDAAKHESCQPCAPVRAHHDHIGVPLVCRINDRRSRIPLGVVQNPSHLMLPDLIRIRYGAERPKVDMPVRSLVAMGLPLALGSDGPLNPFLNLMFAGTYPSKPAEALTREQALSA